jgi:hypothetical protein
MAGQDRRGDHRAWFPVKESISPIDTKPLPSFANPAVIPN